MVIRNVWARLTRKQFLVLYPFALGFLNTLAFLAIYLSAEDTWSWDAFAIASYNRFAYLQDNVVQSGDAATIAAAAVAAVLVVLLSAAIRAPFFRAIVGLGYPLAPAGVRELIRLSLLYALTYSAVVLLPLAFPSEGAWFQAVSLVVFFGAIAFLFADYALVFEELGPGRAIIRSVGMVRRNLLLALVIYSASALAWIAVDAVYQGYFQEGDSVFILLPISYLLVDALVTVIVDAVLIFVYFDRSKA